MKFFDDLESFGVLILFLFGVIFSQKFRKVVYVEGGEPE